MSGNLDPYLYLNDELCLICGEGLGNDASTISREGWPKIQSLAKEWSLLPIKPGNEYYQYTLVYSKIAGKGEPFGQRHRKNKCRANFGKKSLLEKLQKIYITDSEGATCSSFLNDSFEIRGGADPPHPPLITSPRTRSTTGNTTQFAQICFICNEIRSCDVNKFREGGLGVCEFESAAERLLQLISQVKRNHMFI